MQTKCDAFPLTLSAGQKFDLKSKSIFKNCIFCLHRLSFQVSLQSQKLDKWSFGEGGWLFGF